MNLATATPWLVALAGLFVCFRGYRAFKFGLVLTAFLIGAHVALLRVDLLPADPEWLRPVGVVVAGLLAAVLVGVAWRLGVMLLGMVGLTALVLNAPNLPTDPGTRFLILAAAALAGALLARFLERVTLTLLTAAYGAFMVVSVVSGHLQKLSARPVDAWEHLTRGPAVWFAVWLLLTAAGAVAQHRSHFGKREPEERA